MDIVLSFLFCSMRYFTIVLYFPIEMSCKHNLFSLALCLCSDEILSGSFCTMVEHKFQVEKLLLLMIFHLFLQQYIFTFLGGIGYPIIFPLIRETLFTYASFNSGKGYAAVGNEMFTSHSPTVTWFPYGIIFIFTFKLSFPLFLFPAIS